MVAIMEPLDQTEDVEKQSAVIKGETLGEKKEENVEIKTEVKEEYVEPASLSQVKLDPPEPSADSEFLHLLRISEFFCFI